VSDVGRGGGVAASATLTPVEMGASAVIEEDAGLVVDGIHDNGGDMELGQRRRRHARRYSVSHVDGVG
jgi:hypothetical protein